MIAKIRHVDAREDRPHFAYLLLVSLSLANFFAEPCYTQEFKFRGELQVDVADGEECREDSQVTYPIELVMDVDEEKNFTGFMKVSRNLIGQVHRGDRVWTVTFRHYDRSEPEILSGTMTSDELDLEMILERDSPALPCRWNSARVVAREIPGGSEDIDSFATCSREYKALEYSQLCYDAFIHSDYTRALGFAIKAYNLVPDHSVYQATLGRLYEQQGDKEGARNLLKKSLEQALGQQDHELVQQIAAMLEKTYDVYPDWVETRRAKFSEHPPGFDGEEFHSEMMAISNLLSATQEEIARRQEDFDDFARFEKEALQGLKVIETYLGKNHVDYWEGLEVLARLMTMMTNFELIDADAKAEQYLREAFALRQRNLGTTHPDTLKTLEALGDFMQQRDRLKDALDFYSQMADGYENLLGRSHPQAAAALFRVADVLLQLGDSTTAETLMKEALASNVSNLGPHHPATLEQHEQLSQLYSYFGAYDQAEPHLLQAREISQQVYGDNDLRTLRVAKELAVLYKTQGQWEKARDILLELFEHIDVNPSLSDLAQKISEVRDLEAWYADREARRELMLEALEQSVDAYAGLNDYKVAGSICLKLIEVLTQTYGEDHYRTLMAKSRMAHIHDSLHLFAEAAPLHQEALTGLRSSREINPAPYLLARNNMGAHYLIQGRYSSALPLLEESYRETVDLLGLGHPRTIVSMSNYAYLLALSGRDDDAIKMYGEYVRCFFKFLNRVIWTTSEDARASYLDNHLTMDYYYSLLLAAKTPQARKELLFLSLNRKGLHLSVSSRVRRLYASIEAASPESQRKLVELKERTRGYFAMAAHSLGTSSATDVQSLRSLEEEISRLEVELSGEIKRENDNSLDSAPEERLEDLGDDEVLVDFIVFTRNELKGNPGGQEYVVAVVVERDPGGPGLQIRVVELGPAEPIQRQLILLRRRLVDRGSVEAPTRALYDLLWEPLQPHLGKARDVLLVPDGMLHLLPFGILQNRRGEELAALHRIVYLSRSGDLKRSPDRPPGGPSAIYYDPDFDLGAADETGQTFQPLPGTRKEGEELAALFRRHNLPYLSFSKESANEQSLASIVRPKILHLATHGYFLDAPAADGSRGVNPKAIFEGESAASTDPLLRSGLALAGANMAAADETPVIYNGIVTARETLLLDLWGTELVVLSACETGLGSVRNGEGVYSLSRSFLEAGAQKVLLTLWRVDDEATQAFMIDFYSRFLDGVPPREALRETKEKFAEEGRWQHPYYWAPFIIVGER